MKIVSSRVPCKNLLLISTRLRDQPFITAMSKRNLIIAGFYHRIECLGVVNAWPLMKSRLKPAILHAACDLDGSD